MSLGHVLATNQHHSNSQFYFGFELSTFEFMSYALEMLQPLY
jgi:hypothetical protein